MESSDIHVFEISGERLLLDVEEGELYSVSAEGFDLACRGVTDLAEIGNLTFSKWKAFQELSQIHRRSNLTEHPRKSEISEKLAAAPLDLRGLWLGIAHDCNLDCAYCFAKEPEYLTTRSLMHPDIARDAVDFMVSQAPEQDEFEIGFFGGEPLLNLDAMEAVFAHCSKLDPAGKRFKYSITTNGTLLSKEVYLFLVENGVDIMVSLDPDKDRHDRYRVFKGGAPSWNTILRNLDRLPDWPEHLVARSTLSDSEVSMSSAFDNLTRLGFKQMALEGLSPNSGIRSELTDERRQASKDDYLSLARRIALSVKSVHEIPLQGLRLLVERQLKRQRKYYSCGTGVNYLYVTPDGEIMPCPRLLSNKREFLMGTVHGHLNESVLARFRRNHIYNRVCAACWARYLCGGQCYGDVYFVNGNLTGPLPGYCDIAKHRIEVGAYVVNLLMKSGKLRPSKGPLRSIVDSVLPFRRSSARIPKTQ